MSYRSLVELARTEREGKSHSTAVPNSAGGYSFLLDDWKRLDRFLVLGSEGGTYYVHSSALTRENATCVARCLKEDGCRVVRIVAEISDAGRAISNDYALFVLAMAASAAERSTREAALAVLPCVARTGTHLFHFAQYIEGFRGWGRGLRRAIAKWYLDRDVEDLSLQIVKYQQRDGWSHRDLLRLAHPKTRDPARQAILGYALQPDNALRVTEAADRFRLVQGTTELQRADDSTAADVIRRYSLPREVVPTQHLKDARVWDALLADMPITALIRNLATMTSVGFLQEESEAARFVADAVKNQDRLKKARVHPMTLLLALKTYASGRGIRGNLQWNPVRSISDALEEGFYRAFKAVEPTDKRILLALDVSASMSQKIANTAISAAEASAAMALVTAAIEPGCTTVGFCGPQYSYDRNQTLGITVLPIGGGERLELVTAMIRSQTMGATDCALPMLYATAREMKVDAFIVFTDSETWAGTVQPAQALRAYREESGIAAKLIVVGMTSTRFTIADPNDAGMLDIAGFDANTPSVISDFISEK